MVPLRTGLPGAVVHCSSITGLNAAKKVLSRSVSPSMEGKAVVLNVDKVARRKEVGAHFSQVGPGGDIKYAGCCLHVPDSEKEG